MPGLAQRNDQSINAISSCHSLSSKNGSVSTNGFWSKHGGDISYNQLQKFWSELSPSARHELLKVDKQNLFEQARKNMYCSRCNGLLLEGFMQIVMYGKSLQQEATGGQLSCYELGVSKDLTNGGSCEELTSKDELQDPSVHPWGGLTTTRDGVLTLLDCYLYSKSLMGLQNVFDSARARERERELLYPDACGGGGRGWISQGMVTYGRGHGTRETCALHTARLSCDTLVDFWSALGDETRQSLLRMKEEDFIERLIYRFDSKRFCRDCRRNVIREFKELKELKRMKREPRCTTWFCAADASFQYEVSNDTIHADWRQTFADSSGIYHHFEWAVGTGEGKSDILDYENVGTSGNVQINGLDLGGFSACYITLRAWKLDGRCTELSVKAHALEGEQCVHSGLMVGDGYVTISFGEDIRTFFEHAEEAEEDEDDNSMDRDGNELDGECSRPQKHAKSPELAREFLLDAATVIFKEQVEKAFREGTARQNAHSIFVCLAVKLLEERVHVACKEIVTLEKQMKLLEEEEKEKREEEERKERKRTKEREKKLRRKERLRGKDKMKKCVESNTSVLSDFTDEVSSPRVIEEIDTSMEEMAGESADPSSNIPATPNIHDITSPNGCMPSGLQYNVSEGENIAGQEENDWLTTEDSKLPQQKLKVQTEFQLCSSRRRPDRHRKAESGSTRNKPEVRYCNVDPECSSRGTNELNRLSRPTTAKFSSRNCGPRFDHKLQCTSNRMTGRNDLHSCGCDQHSDYREKVEPHGSTMKLDWGNRSVNKMDSASNSLKPVHRINKLNQTDYTQENCGKSKSKIPSHSSSFSREPLYTKRVWEPVEPQKRYARCNSDSDVTLRSSSFNVEVSKPDKSGVALRPFDDNKKIAESMDNSDEANDEIELCLTRTCKSTGSPDFSVSSSASSDNCSSCLSEGENNTASSNIPTQESSSTSDSEDGSQLSEGRESLVHPKTEFSDARCETEAEKVQNNYSNRPASNLATSSFSSDVPLNFPWNPVQKNGATAPSMGDFQQGLPSQILNQQSIHYSPFQAPPMMGYYHQNQRVSWPTAPANGFVPYAQPSPYMFTSPFSYGLGADPSYCVQYGATQHLPSLLDAAQFPPYQPRVDPNPSRFLTKPCGIVNPSDDNRRENIIQSGGAQKVASLSADEQKPSNFQTGSDTGFSLFQFAGPVPRALSTIRSNMESSDEELCGDLSPELSTDHGDDSAGMEEYNLFAASKGIEFSIF